MGRPFAQRRSAHSHVVSDIVDPVNLKPITGQDPSVPIPVPAPKAPAIIIGSGQPGHNEGSDGDVYIDAESGGLWRKV